MTVSEISGGGFQGVSYVAVLGGSPGSFPGIADSDLYLPLKNTLVPTRGASTPTFTRALGTAWDFDSEGKLNLNIPAGCPRFTGARLVRNLLTIPTEDLTSAGWTKADTTITANAIANSIGEVAADKLVESATTAAHTVNSLNGFSVISGVTYRLSVEVKKAERTKSFFGVTTTFPTTFISVDLDTGVVATAVGSPLGAKSTNLGNDWWRVEFNVAATSTGFGVVDCRTSLDGVWANRVFLGELTKGIFVTRFQIENVTGQADQTASEYVSVGVLAAPFHGAGVDGCKYFTTNKDGSAIPAATLKGYCAEPSRVNNLLYSRGALAGAKAGKWIPSVTGSAILTDNFSTYADTAAMLAAGWTATSSVATLQSGKIRVATQTNTVQAYTSKSFATTIGKTYVVAAELVTDASTAVIYIGVGSSAINVSDAARSVTATGLCYLTFVASASTSHLTLYNGGTSSVAGEYAEWDNITISEAAIVPTDTATGLDNVANSASRLTAAANDATLLQLLTAATGTRTTSVWIKRVSGSGTVSLTRNGGTGWTDITSSLVAGTWVPVEVVSDVGANPTVGLKMGTSGDVIDVDCFQDENGAWRTSPILTTTAAVTRNADVLSYASAFDVTQGTALCSATSATDTSSGGYLLTGDANGRFSYLTGGSPRAFTSSYDGTLQAGVTGNSLASAVSKRVTRWGVDQRCCADGTLGSVQVFDGTMGAATTLYVGCSSAGVTQLSGNIGEVHVWNAPLTDAQMQQVTT